VGEVQLSLEAPVNEAYEDVAASSMRKVISKRLTASKRDVPHFYTSATCDITELMRFRKQLKEELGASVSVNDLVIKAASMALRAVPEANASWDEATGTVKKGETVDISVAVATPAGLITPIVTGADARGLSDISATVRDLATRARDGKLKPEEYQGGSFTISNLGMFGIQSFTAVINVRSGDGGWRWSWRRCLKEQKQRQQQQQEKEEAATATLHGHSSSRARLLCVSHRSPRRRVSSPLVAACPPLSAPGPESRSCASART